MIGDSGRRFINETRRITARALRLLPLAALLLVLGFELAAAGHTAQAQSASGWNKRGQAAEARSDYDAAYQDYRQAHTKSPTDLRYKTRYENMRFRAAAAHVDRGRVFLQNGDAGGALFEFQRALEIDPSNQTAQQEIDQIRATLASGDVVAGPAMQQTARQNDTLKQIGSVNGITQLKPTSNDMITLHMVEDTKNIYQAIGKEAGINVLFDPDYVSKRIPVDLANVSLSDALHIVGTISGTFYKAVTPNTIFVAQNTRQKRTDLDDLAVQTFYLTNMSTANDATEVLTAIRNLLDPSVKIFLVPSQNAIVMRATPDQLMLAEKLLNDLDRAKSEVVVDVAVLEVNRTLERKLGLQLPQSFGLAAQANPNATSTSSSTGSTGSSTTTTSSFTLNSLAHLSANNFAVTIGGAEADALLTDNDTRILQNPRIRASDGQKATLKIGSKIPIATGSYSAGAATGLSAGVGVQTQFTYIDVGVNIEMTPTVHYDREVTLKLKIEVSTENGQVNEGSGVIEPIISQRTAEQVIQLKDGEPSILAGLLTKNESMAITGTPGLGELPLLKYIFNSRDKNLNHDEIVFLVVPHIVRESLLSKLNTRAIDTGTSQAIELRHDNAPTTVEDMADASSQSATGATMANAANAASALVHPQQPGQPQATLPAQIPQPNEAMHPGVSAAAAAAGAVTGTNGVANAAPPVVFSIQPVTSSQAVGSTFQATVNVGNAQDVFSVPLQLEFNPAVLQLVNVDAGPFLGSDGQAVALVHRDEGNGLVTISSSRPPNVKGMSGHGAVCTLTFKAIAPGKSDLRLVKVGARNSGQVNLPAVGLQASVEVK